MNTPAYVDDVDDDDVDDSDDDDVEDSDDDVDNSDDDVDSSDDDVDSSDDDMDSSDDDVDGKCKEPLRFRRTLPILFAGFLIIIEKASLGSSRDEHCVI